MGDESPAAAEAPVVVFGGTGHYGSNVVRALLARGTPVRVVSRDAARARERLGAEIDVVEGDVTAPDTVARALDGARAAVVALSALTPQLIRRRTQIERDAVLEILRVASASGPRRVVYLSVYDIDEDFLREHGIEEIAANHRAVEQALRDGDLDWTILGCAPSFEFFFTFFEKGAIPGGGDHPNPTMAPEDLGEIAAQAALRDDLGGRRFRMAGAEALSCGEAARRVDAATGRTTKLQTIPLGVVRVAALLSRPFTPFVRFIHTGLVLHTNFPQHLVNDIPQDHATLREVFDFEPTPFEEAAVRRFGAPDA